MTEAEIRRLELRIKPECLWRYKEDFAAFRRGERGFQEVRVHGYKGYENGCRCATCKKGFAASNVSRGERAGKRLTTQQRRSA